MPARRFVDLRRLAMASVLFAVFSGCAGKALPAGHAPVFYGGTAPSVVPDVRAAPPPVIQSIWISGKTFKGGDLVRIRVTASTNVAVVEMRTFSSGRALIKHDFGKFGCAYHVPVLPPFARIPYTLTFHFIARDGQGTPVSEDAAINIRG